MINGHITLNLELFKSSYLIKLQIKKKGCIKLQFGEPKIHRFSLGRFLVRSPLLKKYQLVSFPSLSNMLNQTSNQEKRLH